jgi:GntR family transcriptional repressor for pyruvate dehydrogenase complex
MKLEAIPRPPSLVEKVCEQLALIVRRDLKVVDGWLPTERELSTRLGVSRSVVREATKRLESQGLVEIRHGIGIKAVDRLHRPLSDSLSLVIPDMADRLRSLIEARLSIEPDAAAFAAERATKKQLRELRATHERLESASSQDAAVKADCAFHRGVAEASGNLVYRLILDSVAELDVAAWEKIGLSNNMPVFWRPWKPEKQPWPAGSCAIIYWLQERISTCGLSREKSRIDL